MQSCDRQIFWLIRVEHVSRKERRRNKNWGTIWHYWHVKPEIPLTGDLY